MTARRWGVVYGIRVLDAATLSTIELGYVGKTRQALRARETQHRESRPWEDIIVGSAYIIAEARWSDAELDAAEMSAIQLLKPRYNLTGNGGNEDRTSPAVALTQRHARDRVRADPLWDQSQGAQIRTALVRTDAMFVQPPATVHWVGGVELTCPQFPIWVGNPAPLKANARQGRSGLHQSHRAVLAQVAAGLVAPGAIAAELGLSDRQVFNLLRELMNDFGLVARLGHGRYELAPESQR